MSYNPSAILLLGVFLDATQVSAWDIKEKAFPHNHPENWNLDPITGKKLWDTCNSLEEDADDNHLTYQDSGSGMWVGVNVGSCNQNSSSVVEIQTDATERASALAITNLSKLLKRGVRVSELRTVLLLTAG